MREIKFRAWDKVNNIMRDSEYVKFQENFWDNSNYIPLQYTGRKDKNGKEIYEGDIIHFVHEIEEVENLPSLTIKSYFVVVWGEGGWSLEEHRQSPYSVASCSPYNPSRKFLYDYDPSGNWLRQEIIGNIYENPELLK